MERSLDVPEFVLIVFIGRILTWSGALLAALSAAHAKLAHPVVPRSDLQYEISKLNKVK